MSGYVIAGAMRPDGTTGDLYVADGRFVAEPPPGAERTHADGLRALPGLVDPHTHLREPGREDAETVASGTRAAARGGFTAVMAMANTAPVTDTAERAAHVRDLGRGADALVTPIGSITRNLAGRELSDIAGMHAHVGTQMFSDDGMCVMDAGLMRRSLEAVRVFDGVIAQHSQDHNLAPAAACCHESRYSEEFGLTGWPAEAESIIIARDVQLAKLTGARLHVCHLSTAESVEIVRWAKQQGIRVTAEVTPHHLLLTTPLLASHDTTFKVNPPLRTDEHVEAVRAGLADGTIDVVGTDHAPHAASDKARDFPDAKPGMIGLEQALAVVLETLVNPGRLDWATLAERMSHAPARLAGLTTQGRPLAVGEPANLTLVDPAARAAVDRDASASISRNNPYHGLDLPDPIVATMYAGRVTYRA